VLDCSIRPTAIAQIQTISEFAADAMIIMVWVSLL
jgi:hypothetical protein